MKELLNCKWRKTLWQDFSNFTGNLSEKVDTSFVGRKFQSIEK